MTPSRFLAILLLLAAAVGCAKMPPTHYYLLGPQHSPTSTEASSAPQTEGWTVGVRSFHVDAPYDQDHIVYRVGDDSREIGFYAYHRWAAPPSRMLPVLVADALTGVAGIGRIEPAMPGRTYAAYLDGRVLRLEEVDRPDGQLVRVHLTLWLTGEDGAELWSGGVEAEGTAHTSEVRVVVDRMSGALAAALERVRDDLAAALPGAR